uniref:Rubis-subs-bind domain-containing protein n=1 Tax=Dracunculus medinensis TaxID=318479 RepID=A0A0N4U575_DRAME
LAEFLKGTDESVKKKFMSLYNDPDVPSEIARREKIHLLAVSLLTSEQLDAYNKYATSMKRRTSAYAARLRQLSPTAREALYTIALIAQNLSKNVRNELKRFALRRKSLA